MKRNVWMAVSLVPGLSGPAIAQVDPAVIEALQKQVQALTEEVERLKEGPPPSDEAGGIFGTDFLKGKGLTLGFYGETKFRVPERGNGTFDAHRYVLAPGYQIADWLVFNSELELEHGGVDESNNNGRNRFDGELELEQFYVDILLHERFNIRSLGIDLVPVGRVNKQHEPTTFYSTERPELYREIIPSTWYEPSMGVFGKLTEVLDYQLMVSTGLEDAIKTSGSAATTTRPAGYAGPGFDGKSGARNARPQARNTEENYPAFSGRLRYQGEQGLDTSGSFYVTKVEGLTGNSTMTLVDWEALYRVPQTGLELRAEAAYWNISDPDHLVANNNTLTTDDVGDRMYGWYVEAAYHIWPESWKKGKGQHMDLVPFVRFSQIVAQSEMDSGTSEVDDGTQNKDFITAGLSYFLNPNFVIKADWRHNLDSSTAAEGDSAAQDYFQFGTGIAF